MNEELKFSEYIQRLKTVREKLKAEYEKQRVFAGSEDSYVQYLSGRYHQIVTDIQSAEEISCKMKVA